MRNVARSVLHRDRVQLLACALGLVLISACGSTTSKPSAAVGVGSGSQFSQIQAAINNAKSATFKAVYTSQSSGSSGSTTTIEQKPPKTLFSTGTSSTIFDGTTTYECESSGQCTSLPGTTNPLASLAQVYSGSYILTLMQGYQNSSVLAAEGITVNYSNATYAGQQSTCLTVTARAGAGGGSGGGAKWCVTNTGILAYSGGTSGSSSGAFELTSYTTNVPDSDFQTSTGNSTTPTASASPTDTSGAGASPSPTDSPSPT